jgi:hypothetical protein
MRQGSHGKTRLQQRIADVRRCIEDAQCQDGGLGVRSDQVVILALLNSTLRPWNGIRPPLKEPIGTAEISRQPVLAAERCSHRRSGYLRVAAGGSPTPDKHHAVVEIIQRIVAGKRGEQRYSNRGQMTWLAAFSSQLAFAFGLSIVLRPGSVARAARIIRASSDFRYGFASNRNPGSRRP